MPIKFLNDVAVDSSVLYVDTINDRVGIGTDSPDVPLEVNGVNTTSGQGEGLRVTRPGVSSQYISIDEADGSKHRIRAIGNKPFEIFSNSSSYGINFSTNSTESMRITGEGNVGIGTTGPTAPLHIQGGTTSEVLKIEANANPYIRWVENGTNVGYLQFSSTNAYLSNMSSGSLLFRTNNTDKMTITGGGNVGIGTTNPENILHLKSPNPYLILEDTSNANKNRIANVDGNMHYHADYNNQMGNSRHIFYIDNSEKLRINTNGNVGIGTTNPNQKLTIKGNDNYVATEQTNYVWGGTNTIGVRMGTSTAGVLDFRRWDGGVTHGTAAITQVTSDGGWGLDFRVDNKSTNTSATTSRMFLSTSGEVGIGTTNPSAKLTVVDDILLTGSSPSLTLTDATSSFVIKTNTAGEGVVQTNGTSKPIRFFRNNGSSESMRIDGAGKVGIGTTSPQALLNLASDTSGLRIGNSTNSNYYDIQRSNTTGYLDFKGNQTTYSRYRFFTNSTNQVFTILNNGNTGIGTTSPSQKLHVNGATQVDNGGLLLGGTSSVNGNNPQLRRANSSNDLRIATAGSDRVTILGGGNVGIGTSTPGAKLHVLGSQQFILIESTANSDATYRSKTPLGYYGSGTGIGSATNCWNVYDFNAGSERMRISSSGNVGIGTTSPNYMLHLGSGTIGAVNGEVAFGSVANVPSGLIQGYRVDGSYKGELRFSTSTSGGTVTQRMVIDEDGNVGIGTNNPSHALHVGAGSALVSGYIYSGSTSVGFTNFFSYFGAQAPNGMLVRDGSTYKPVLASAFTVSSDYRLKSNIEPLENATSRLKQLEVHRFNWNDRLDEPKVDGFIAHEVSSIVPEAVIGEKDAVHEDGTPKHQGIDQAKLVPLLTAALQEAITKIENLESRIQTLENQ